MQTQQATHSVTMLDATIRTELSNTGTEATFVFPLMNKALINNTFIWIILFRTLFSNGNNACVWHIVNANAFHITRLRVYIVASNIVYGVEQSEPKQREVNIVASTIESVKRS